MTKKQVIILAIAAATVLSLSSCGNSKVTGGSKNYIEQSKWKLESIGGEKNTAFAQGDSFTLEFLPQEKRVAGVGACNRFFGQYELIKRDNIDIKMGGSTMMACPNLNLEQPYFKMLDEADKYKIENGKLILYSTDKAIAVFNKYIVDMHNAQNALDYIGENTLTMLDGDGNAVTGELAPMFVLKKK